MRLNLPKDPALWLSFGVPFVLTYTMITALSNEFYEFVKYRRAQLQNQTCVGTPDLKAKGVCSGAIVPVNPRK